LVFFVFFRVFEGRYITGSFGSDKKKRGGLWIEESFLGNFSARAVRLGLGAASAKQIEFVIPDAENAKFAKEIEKILSE